MDIICAKCGRHLNSIEAARDHAGHCIGGDIAFYIPSSTKQTQSNANRQDNESQPPSESYKYEVKCPLTKREEFHCPRCGYCKSETERKEFFKAITYWYCKYPQIVNEKMLTPKDFLEMPTMEDNQGERQR
jgi:hypothetical protein